MNHSCRPRVVHLERCDFRENLEILSNFHRIHKIHPFWAHEPKYEDHIIDRTSRLLGEFQNLISSIYADEFTKIGLNRDLVLEKTIKVNKAIITALVDFQAGNLIAYYNNITSLIKDIKIPIVQKPANYSLYRVREFNNNEKNTLPSFSMFHVPFDQVRKLRNNRFSLSGYPCLYLAENIGLCIKEIQANSDDNLFVARFDSQKELNLLNLTYPTSISSINDILVIPLVLSCTLPVYDKNAIFVPEYIMPQGVLHSIININQLSDSTIDGLIYHSSHWRNNQDISLTYDSFFNVVIPTINREYSKRGHCSTLVDMFNVTNGVRVRDKDRLRNMSSYRFRTGICKPMHPSLRF